MREVTIFIHYKQGDDLNGFLSTAKNPVQGLRDWADGMSAGAEAVRHIASFLEGKDIEIDADTHHIGVSGLSETDVDKIAKLGGISIDEFDSEDDCSEDDNCDCKKNDNCDCGKFDIGLSDFNTSI